MIVEVMARAAWETREQTFPESCRMPFEPRHHSMTMEMMRAAIRAAADAGFVLVPKEPTYEMIAAGTGTQHAANTWLAMVHAAPKPVSNSQRAEP